MEQLDNGQLTEATPSPPRARLTAARLLVYAGLLFLSLAMTASFLRPDQCRSLCSSDTTMSSLEVVQPRVAVDEAHSGSVLIWVDVAMSGVYSPALTSGPLEFDWLHDDDEVKGLPSFLDELAEKGYLAIRVPHAPPDYATSQIVPGLYGSPAVEFRYYSPPDAATATTVEVSVTRIVTYEAIVNSLYPISDNHSHWEVWWIDGDRFPVPTGTFQLKEEGAGQEAIEVALRVDVGEADASACAGAEVEILLYNGYTFVGPFGAPLSFSWSPPGNPLVLFDQGCHEYGTYLEPITPSVPFSLTHWLANYDTVTRTFTIEADSSEDWEYTYYYGPAGQPLQRAAGLPFNVDVGPASGWEPTCIDITAVHTPTIAVTDKMRETLVLSATSVISPEVQASISSVALAPGYTLDEGSSPQYSVYLPFIVRQAQ